MKIEPEPREWENIIKMRGLTFVVDIVKNQKSFIQIENDKNGIIKKWLFDEMEINFKKFSHKNFYFYRRSNAVVAFFEGDYDNNPEALCKLLENLHKTARKIMKKYEKRLWIEGDVFLDSYGADFSRNNFIFKLNKRWEIFGKNINLANKIAKDDRNKNSLYIGNEIAKIFKDSQEFFFNLKKEHISLSKNLFYKWESQNVEALDLEKYIEEKINNQEDGIIYFDVDIKNSTEILLLDESEKTFSSFMEALEKLKEIFCNYGYKNQFQGDGYVFWKTAVNLDNNEFKKIIQIIEKIKDKRAFLNNNKQFFLKVAATYKDKYLQYDDEYPPFSEAKILAEILQRKNKNDEGEIFSSSVIFSSDFNNFLKFLKLSKKDFSSIDIDNKVEGKIKYFTLKIKK